MDALCRWVLVLKAGWPSCHICSPELFLHWPCIHSQWTVQGNPQKSKESCAGLWNAPRTPRKSATCLCQTLVRYNRGGRGRKPLIPSAAGATSWQGLIGADVERENWTRAKAGPSVAGGGTPVKSPRTSENRRLGFYCV